MPEILPHPAGARLLIEEAEWLLRYEGDDWTASDTAGALGRIGTEEAVDLLISALAEEQTDQHGWAITALGETGNYALEEGERWRKALDVLRKLDLGAARLVLHERVRGGPCPETEIRLLAEMGDTTIVPRLINILQSEPHKPRPPLVRMLVERYSRETYREARDALRKLTGENLESYEEWRTWYEAHPVSPSQE